MVEPLWLRDSENESESSPVVTYTINSRGLTLCAPPNGAGSG